MTRKTITNALIVALVAMGIVGMTANAAIVPTIDGPALPADLPQAANDDLLQSNLASKIIPGPTYGSIAGLTDGDFDISGSTFGWQEYVKNTDHSLTFVLDGFFDIGMIRVTSGYISTGRNEQEWDVFTSVDTTDGTDGTWVQLGVHYTAAGADTVAGQGHSISLPSDSGHQAAGVKGIRFDVVALSNGTGWGGDSYQEIDVFVAPPPAGTVIMLK